MKTEKEVYNLAKSYQEHARIASKGVKSAENKVDRDCYLDVCREYNQMLSALAKVLNINEYDLWVQIDKENTRDKIPLHIRLRGISK